MRMPSSDVAFTAAVKAVQERRGSRAAYARMEANGGFQTEVPDARPRARTGRANGERNDRPAATYSTGAGDAAGTNPFADEGSPMKKLLLVVLCSTSLLSVARGEGSGGMGSGSMGSGSMGTDDAMHRQDAKKPDGAQAPGTEAKPKKPAKKQAADPKTKHGAMDHGAMEHGAGMDHGSMQQDAQMDGGTK